MASILFQDPHHNIFNSVLGKGNVKNWKTQLEEEIQKEEQEEKNRQENEDKQKLRDDAEYEADEETESLGFVENE